MDDVVELVFASDANHRQQAYDAIVKMLENPSELAAFQDFGRLFEGVCHWMTSSSQKICLNGLDLVSRFAEKLGERLRYYAPQFIPVLFDKLGDTKEQVRKAAHDALGKLTDSVCSTQFIFDQVPSIFLSKQPRIRDESLVYLRNALERYGGKGIAFPKLAPSVAKLLDDADQHVREDATLTLVLAYKVYGEECRTDLIRRNLIPSNKMPSLQAKFDEVSPNSNNTSPSQAASSTNISPPKEKPLTLASPPSRTPSTSNISPRSPLSPGGREDGSVDEEIFQAAFDETIQQAKHARSRLFFATSREVRDFMAKSFDVLSNKDADWEKRIGVLHDLRFYVVLDGANISNTEFWMGLRNLEVAFQHAVRDLRSQIVRETCVTIAFFATQFGETGKLEHFAEAILPYVLLQLPHSAKIMSTSATTCVHFLVKGVQSSKLIPIIAGQLGPENKSAIIRRHCCEFLEAALSQWSKSVLDKQKLLLVEAVKRGLNDADQEARAFSRKSYWLLKGHFPMHADVLFGQLDGTKQKYLLADQPFGATRIGSQQGSIRRPAAPQNPAFMSMRQPTSSIRSRVPAKPSPGTTTASIVVTPARTRLVSASSSAAPVPTVLPPQRPATTAPTQNHEPITERPIRPAPQITSLSLQPVAITETIKNGNENAATSPPPRTPVVVSPRTITLPNAPLTPSASTNSETTLQNKQEPAQSPSAVARVVVSSPRIITVPASSPKPSQTIEVRSGMSLPSAPLTTSSRARLERANTITTTSTASVQPELSKSSSQIPVFQFPTPPAPPPATATLSLLPQPRPYTGSRSNANLHDLPPQLRSSFRTKTPSTSGDNDIYRDRSRTAMGSRTDVSSFSPSASPGSSAGGSYLPYSPSMERLGSNPHLYRSFRVPTSSSAGLINMLSSSSSDKRKTALTELQALLTTGQLVTLSQTEINQFTSAFTKLFNDPKRKVVSQFLEVLIEFVKRFHQQLHDWLFVMLMRLFARYGTEDLLPSDQSRVASCIDVARWCFHTDLQFSAIVRVLLDPQTQTQTAKSKLAVLDYLRQLVVSMDQSQLVDSVDFRLVLSRLIAWSTDDRSLDVRRTVQNVIISFFNLNSAEFCQILMKLQPKMQTIAMTILQTHVHGSVPQPQRNHQVHQQQTNFMARQHDDSGRATPGTSSSTDLRPEDMSRVREMIQETTSDIVNLSRTMDGTTYFSE